MSRGRFDPHHRHAPPPPPPPPAAVSPTPQDSADSDQVDPDDNPYRPASFRVRDELEEEQEEEVTRKSSTVTEQPKKSIPQVPEPSTSPVRSLAPPSAPTGPKTSQPQSNNSQMLPPQSRPNVQPNMQKRRSSTQGQGQGEGSKGFRPFSLNLSSKARNNTRLDPSQRLRGLTAAREKAQEPAQQLHSAGAEATSQVVEALKAVSVVRPPVATPKPTRPAPLPPVMDPNDPHRFSVYERVTMVGEGTYGKVYKAKNKNTGQLVALKRIRMESERDGVSSLALRNCVPVLILLVPNYGCA